MRAVMVAALMACLALGGCAGRDVGPGPPEASLANGAGVGRLGAEPGSKESMAAAAGSDATGWSLPGIRVGDVVVYGMPGNGEPYEWTFEVREAATAFDRSGVSHPVFVVAAIRPADGRSSDPTYEGFSSSTWRYDPGARSMVTSGDGHRSTGDDLGVHEDWEDIIHGSATRMNALPLCGFFNTLQGTTLPATDEVHLLVDLDCLSTGPWLDGSEYPFRWTGTGEVNGRAVEWFEDATRRSDHLRLAFNGDIPYPVAVSYGDQVATMVSFARGTGAAAAPAPTGSITIPAYTTVERGVPGPDDREAPIPFTLHEAFTAAMESPSFTDVQEFMAAHPEARAFQAHSQAMRHDASLPLLGEGTQRLIWTVTLVSQGGTLHFCVERPATEDSLPVIGGLLDSERYDFGVGTAECGYGQGGEIPPVSSLPDEMPDVVPLFPLWKHYQRMEWNGGGPDHWGYSYGCHEAGCTDPFFSVWVGNSWSWDDASGHHWGIDALHFRDGHPTSTTGLLWED